MRFIGIIPSRYGSSRFPGKPLALIGGKPMVQRVYEQASLALDQVVVATDDERIYDCVKGFGGEVVMTRTDHRCGTERCVEAYVKTKDERPLRSKTKDDEDDIIINIQGDEPFIQPEQIKALMGCFEGELGAKTDIATLVQPYTEQNTWEELVNPNSPKVVFDADHRAILFSRSVIPYLRGIDQADWLKQHKHFKHIGMYAYRAKVLQQLTLLPPSGLEQAESLEQLRWLEDGYSIRVAECTTASIGIDTPEDLIKAEEFYKSHI
ncbi:MAG: 3-deoxy-manno-octulosonate cytidylyltransferase [Paludibacteraceae bacterium]|nr:3-deoxy-manno-octulosonate cytidylyltransferase [Paludibacteraceae bacterium]